MISWKVVYVVLVSVAAVNCHTCPDNGDELTFPDVTKDCKVYFRCSEKKLIALNCPDGQAFDQKFGKCRNSTFVSCQKAGNSSSPDELVELITIKLGVRNFLKKFQLASNKCADNESLLMNDDVRSACFSAIDDWIDYSILFFEEVVYPSEILSETLKKVIEEIVSEIHTSEDISNSMAHFLNPFITTKDDSISRKTKAKDSEISFSKLLNPLRVKRQTKTRPYKELSEMIMDYIEPFLYRLFVSLKEFFIGQENTLTSKVIIPVIFEMILDKETVTDLQNLYWTTKAAVSPIIADMYNAKPVPTTVGYIIRIPKSDVDQAWIKFKVTAKPILGKIMEKHFNMITDQIADHFELLLETFELLSSTSPGKIGVLMDYIRQFGNKHRQLYEASKPPYLYFYTVQEILTDLRRIKITIFQIFVEYLSKLNNSFVNGFFNENSYLYKLIYDDTQTYAKPSKNY